MQVPRIVSESNHLLTRSTPPPPLPRVLLQISTDHHPSLLLDADCYHLLEWCVASYPTDAVLQQSASAALQRLQATLSKHESLRRRFQAKHVERKTALEAELLLPEDELWISDSDGGADASDSDDDVP